MAGDERRAEVEAATDALLEDSGLRRYGAHRATVERRVRIAFEAVDRLRDARGDDEAARDHVCYVENGRCQYPGCCRRVSPSRDGTVAVEDVLTEARAALHDLCRERGSTDGYARTFARINAVLAEFARSATGEQTDHGGDQ